jgi:tetratricopeptide (TPR) repeat protein
MPSSLILSRHLSGLIVAAILGTVTTLALGQSGDDEVTPEVQRLYSAAKAAQQHSDNSEAIEKYKAMIKLAPHLAAAYNNLGMLYFNERDYADASVTLAKGLKLHPDMPTASGMLGMSYYQLGMYDKAEPLVRAAVKANPTDDQAEMMLANVYIKLRKYSEATETLSHFLERRPKDQEAWYLLGKTYLQMSEDALARINEIDPDSVVAHEIAGEIDESMHNYDSALVEYKKAIDLAPAAGWHAHAHGQCLLADRQMGVSSNRVPCGACDRCEQLQRTLEARQCHA